MKLTRRFLVVFLLFWSPSLFAQGEIKSDEEQIQKLVQDMFDGLFSGFDSSKIPLYLTDDFILLEDGMIWDNQIITNYLNSQKAKDNLPIRINRFEFFQTKVFGDRAWAAYKNWATITLNGNVIREVHWLESITAVKTDDGWKMEMMHSTPVRNK
jgi:hypothetical protein